MAHLVTGGKNVFFLLVSLLVVGCTSGTGTVDSSDETTRPRAPSKNEVRAAARTPEPTAPELAKSGGSGAGFLRVPLEGNRIIYFNPNNSLEAYDSWIIKPAVVEFHEDQKPLTKAELRSLQKMLEEMQYSQTAASGGEIVSTPSSCTLQQSLKLTALQLNTLEGEGVSQLNVVKSFGSGVVMAEIRDSVSGELVFAYSALASLGGGVTGHSGPQIARLEQTLVRVLAEGEQAVFQRFPLSEERIGLRKHLGCNGDLGRNAFERRVRETEAP